MVAWDVVVEQVRWRKVQLAANCAQGSGRNTVSAQKGSSDEKPRHHLLQYSHEYVICVLTIETNVGVEREEHDAWSVRPAAPHFPLPKAHPCHPRPSPRTTTMIITQHQISLSRCSGAVSRPRTDLYGLWLEPSVNRGMHDSLFERFQGL